MKRNDDLFVYIFLEESIEQAETHVGGDDTIPAHLQNKITKKNTA
jgi:hypothetical protein